MDMRDLFTWILFLWTAVHGFPSPPFKPHPRVEVKKGRAVYLEPGHLFENGGVVEGNRSCRLQVRTDEPISQRVGKVEPQVIDCNFGDNQVKYTHNGSPLLQRDTVVFQVYIFSTEKTEHHILQLEVIVLDTDYDFIVLTDSQNTLTVSHENWLSAPLDTSVLRFKYSFNYGTYCSVSYSEYSSQWPLVGHLVGGLNRDYIQEFTEDCNDFLYKSYHYEYLGGLSPQMDYIPLKVKFYGGVSGDSYIEENLFLPVQVLNTKPNSFPTITNKTVTLSVREYDIQVLDNALIQAWDEEGASEYIVYNVSYPATPSLEETGYFVNLNDPKSAITSFYQRDLSIGMIGYFPRVHTNGNKYRELVLYESLGFELTAFDTHFASSQQLHMNIVIKIDERLNEPILIPNALVVNEGERATISADYFIFPSTMNLDQTHFHVKGGLRHGRLEVNGTTHQKFPYSIIKNSDVVYVHDGSESPSDRISFKISDGTYTYKKRYPVQVLPREDSLPFVTINSEVHVKYGAFAKITAADLYAKDRDSGPEDIVYTVKMPPLAGEIEKLYHRSSQGFPVSTFTQEDIDLGYIYYHHFGLDSNWENDTVTSDSFEFTLSNPGELIRKSGKTTVTIKILSKTVALPKWVESSTKKLVTKETDLAYITKELLEYSSPQTEKLVTYTITKQPFFKTSTITVDAGRIMAANNVTSMKEKDPRVPAVWSFTQEQINTWDIAYMPPVKDIGPIRRYAQFEFSVSDLDGNTVYSQSFDITVLPVNNQVPHLSISTIHVTEGGISPITTQEISAYDSDTDQQTLVFMVKEPPKYGQLLKEDYRMVTGEEFLHSDLAHQRVRYEHDGSEVAEDSFELSVSDGTNIITESVPIAVDLTSVVNNVANDAAHIDIPVILVYPLPDGKDDKTKGLEDKESGIKRQIVTSNEEDARDVAVIHAYSADREDANEEEIEFAEELDENDHVKGEPDSAEYEEASEGADEIVAVQEITLDETFGPLRTEAMVLGETSEPEQSMVDVSEDSDGYIYEDDLPANAGVLISLDPSKKKVLLVEEGGQAYITAGHLSVAPVSVNKHKSRFVLLSPGFGHILLNGVKASEFTLQDVVEDRVMYSHTSGEIGVHPKYDIVTLSVIDDTLASIFNAPLVDMNVTITPVDNQVPELLLGGPIFVQEGESLGFSFEMLSAQDLDTPLNKLRFVISKAPEFGYIENMNYRGNHDQSLGKEVDAFSYFDLKNSYINYVQANHSGTEPIEDFFEVFVTDGTHHSQPAQVKINIIPMNDEMPQFVVGNITIKEGEKKVLPTGFLSASDLDRPMQRLVLSLSEKPHHGELDIVLPSHTGTGEGFEIPMYDVTVDDLQNGRVMLMYKHDGSENFEDFFTLKLTDGIHVTRKRSFVHIIPQNDESPTIVRNSVVSVEFGRAVIMSNSVLLTEDIDSPPEDIFYIMVSRPKKGVVQRKVDKNVVPFTTSYLSFIGSEDDDKWEEVGRYDNFTQSEVNDGNIRYIHTGTSLDGVGLEHGHDHIGANFDGFTFELNDGKNRIPPVTFDIEILQSDSINIALLCRGIKVKEGDTQILSTGMLSASDGSSNPEEIIYTITTPPKFGKLSVVLDKSSSVYSFTQADLESHRIMYTHTSKADTHEDSFKFTVVNGQNHSRNGIFKILIAPVDRILPMLVKNVPLTVVQDEAATITKHHLHILDPDTPPMNLTYIMVESPQYGVLLNRGAVVTQFTQSEVDKALVKYKNGGSNEAGVDYFLFTISDGHNSGFTINGTFERKAAFFNILVQPPEKKPPTLLTVVPPASLETLGAGKYGFIFTSENLKATHPKSESRDIVYAIVEKPMYGYLQNLREFKPIKKKFTQKDVDEGNVAFVLEDGTRATNDSFTFRVLDAVSQSALEDTNFEMSWSLVEFEQTLHIVCEDAIVLLIVLRRYGATNSTVTADIKVKGMSAKEDIDYKLLTSKKIDFIPGQKYSAIDIQIHNDGIPEETEKFRVKLKNAKNAVVGDNDKTIVQIVNLKNGGCEEYIGMISKQKRDPLGLGYELMFPDRTYPTVPPTTTPTTTPRTTTKEMPVFDIFDLKYQFYDEESSSSSHMDFDDGKYRVPTAFPISVDIETLDGKGNKRDKDSSRMSVDKTHPLKKHKEEKKRRKDKKHKGQKQRGSDNSLNYTPQPAVTTIAPQLCTADTKGLLYFDLKNSKIYKCDGTEWTAWGWGGRQSRGFSTSMLGDATSSEVVDRHGEGRGHEDNREEGVMGYSRHQKGEGEQSGCPAGWSKYSNSCFMVQRERVTWSEGERRCQELEAHLAHITSQLHLTWLWKLAQKNKFWTGLSSRGGNEWYYSGGQSVDFYNWKSGYPREGKSHRYANKECVQVIGKAWWVNRPCSRSKAYYVCSKEAEDSDKFPSWYAV